MNESKYGILKLNFSITQMAKLYSEILHHYISKTKPQE